MLSTTCDDNNDKGRIRATITTRMVTNDNSNSRIQLGQTTTSGGNGTIQPPLQAAASSSSLQIPNTTARSNYHHEKISSRAFYSEYHGHKVRHLDTIFQHITTESENGTIGTGTEQQQQQRRIVWTAGDSSLDNKYWFDDTVPAVPNSVYSRLLEPPIMKPDVTYWMNQLLMEQQSQNQTQQQAQQQSQHQTTYNNTVVINTAVEATTVNERTFRLRKQDEYIRDNISSNDILIVSIGGNDVALAPCPCTICSIVLLMYCIPTSCIENSRPCCASTTPTTSTTNSFCYCCNMDDYCCGCCCSVASCCTMYPPCIGYFYHLLGTRIGHYINKLTTRTQPAQILICTIYYPDTNSKTVSWANPALAFLQYNNNPNKLQLLIRKTYELATKDIRLLQPLSTTSTTSSSSALVQPPTIVTAVPLFDVLDGTNTTDYLHRVEPSPSGGKKMAQYLLDTIHDNDLLRQRLIINNNNNNTHAHSLAPTGEGIMGTTTTTTTTPNYRHLHYYNYNAVPQPSVMTDR